MAGTNAAEIRVAGTGRVLVAPKSTPGPAGLNDPWPGAWLDLGFTSEEGVEFAQEDKIEPVVTWQSVAPVRYVYEERALTVKFQLMQVNSRTVPIYFGSGTAVDDGTGGVRVEIPAAPKPQEMAVGIEFTDDGGNGEPAVVQRFQLPRAVVTEAEEAVLTRTDAVKLGVTFTALTPDGPDAGPLAIWQLRETPDNGNGEIGNGNGEIGNGNGDN